MSAHRYRIDTSPQAEADYEHVLLYSMQRWGEARAETYKREIDTALDSLSELPFRGTRRDHVYADSRAIPVRYHYIYYQVLGDTVRILRILHQRQDPTGQFDDLD